MKFEFNYKPEAKKRPRFGKKGKVYDPSKSKHREYKWEAAQQKRSQSSETPLESPVCFNMRVYVPMPKSWPQKRKEASFGKPATSKPDLDNYLKWYMDVLNGIGYKDDRLVTQTFVEKIWSDKGKVEIYLTPHHSSLSILEEIEMMGQFAVHFHETLHDIYDWALQVKQSMTHVKGMESLMDILIEKCLDGGLYETHGG